MIEVEPPSKNDTEILFHFPFSAVSCARNPSSGNPKGNFSICLRKNSGRLFPFPAVFHRPPSKSHVFWNSVYEADHFFPLRSQVVFERDVDSSPRFVRPILKKWFFLQKILFNKVFFPLFRHFWRLFVTALFHVLYFSQVDPYDIQTATDGLCEETPVELDLTTFIKAICGHFKEMTSRRIRRPSGNRKASEAGVSQLYPRPPPETHSSIRAQFQTAIATCLKPIANRPDTFHFALPGFHEVPDGVSASEVDLNSSDVSESSVEFRLDSSNMRESVSGISEPESGPGFFNVNSTESDGDSNGSVFGDSHSDHNADDEEEDGVHNPLFVQFICSVLFGDSRKLIGSYVVKELPTCLSMSSFFTLACLTDLLF